MLRQPLFFAVLIFFKDSLAEVQGEVDYIRGVEWRTGNERINSLVVSLTPEEKISLVHQRFYTGTQDFAGYINPIPRVGIPAIQLADGEA